MKRSRIVPMVFSCLIILAAGNDERAGRQLAPEGQGTMLGSFVKSDGEFGRMPLSFIPNRGQVDAQVAYYIQGTNKTLYFTPGGITFSLLAPDRDAAGSAASGSTMRERMAARKAARGPGRQSAEKERGPERWVLRLEFVGAEKNVIPVGQGETGAVASYFKGKPEEWHAGLPMCSKIVYANLWPGIDLVYRGTVNRLKYEFILQPGADPSRIRLAYKGAKGVSIDESGRLQVTTPLGAFWDEVPVAYQDVKGDRVGVSLAYRLNPSGETEKEGAVYGFELGEYDRSLPLVLDPAILMDCGYIGGSLNDYGCGIAVDGSGNAYVAGYTDSIEITFPETIGPDLSYNGGTWDAFVAKVNATGTGLVYCGYIGGSNYDEALGIAVDAAGNAYIVGDTYSTETTFPVMLGPDLTHNANLDVFVAKINAGGTALSYCGYVGGSSNEFGCGVAVDASGNAYLTGYTGSTEATFPVLAGPDLTYNGGTYDAFMAKVNPSGTGLVYCSYVGGSLNDYGYGIAVDGSENAYVTGYTYSSQVTFPVTVGPDLTFNGGSFDAFVAKVNSLGTGFAYCGYVGGSGNDAARGIAVDRSGNAYLAGYTPSSQTTFPVTVGPDLTFNGGIGYNDAFVAKVNSSGTALVYCGYIGGSLNDFAYGIAVDSSGNAYLTGDTTSTEATFPVIVGPDLTFNGSGSLNDAFAAKVNASGTALGYCGYVGGSLSEAGQGIAADAWGNAYVTGYTGSTQATFPVTAGPDLTHNGAGDVFVAKIYYFDERIPRHAVGDFDGDGTDEIAMDFGTVGGWMWNNGVWTPLTASDPESMIAADVDGNGQDEIAADLGTGGLWLWQGGVWTQLSGANVECLTAGDVDADASDEIVGDFGGAGLWLYDGGAWTQISGVNVESMMTARPGGTGAAAIIGDFGAVGLWLWNGGAWTQLSGVNVDSMAAGDLDGLGGEDLAGDFGPSGLWTWSGSAWTQLSGVNADSVVLGGIDLSGGQEIIGDFALTGLWLWNSGTWTQLSGVNADSMIVADVDGDGAKEVIGDFAVLGLWLWDNGNWSQVSGANAENCLAGDMDGDNQVEISVDFGSLGVWLWNNGAWSQISTNNPD
ncbi:MAG: hypothetical protein A2W03_16890 [Candidatus Aminicenantes bacterium RBG_16_63_16]|nr:MAG: hypothetical protein A2W03_16890 [Candidatus Aminicenantes bacterium RBG_16_63_16]